MIRIDKTLVDKVAFEAKSSTRLRMNYNFHKSPEDPLNRMLNILCYGTYIKPHKHESPDKREVFLVLTGEILIVEFDESGNITSHYIVDHSEGNYGAEISPGTFHTLITLSDTSAIYELKDGPYDVKNDKIFAPWAPDEGTKEAIEFNNTVLGKLGLL